MNNAFYVSGKNNGPRLRKVGQVDTIRGYADDFHVKSVREINNAPRRGRFALQFVAVSLLTAAAAVVVANRPHEPAPTQPSIDIPAGQKARLSALADIACPTSNNHDVMDIIQIANPQLTFSDGTILGPATVDIPKC